VTASLEGEGEPRKRPVLVVRCERGVLDSYVRTPDRVELVKGGAKVTLSIDGVEQSLRAKTDTGQRSIFLPDAMVMLEAISSAEEVVVGYPIMARPMKHARFGTADSGKAADAVRKACGI
jgi:hypothetical protein